MELFTTQPTSVCIVLYGLQMATLLSSITVVSILVMLTFGWVYNAGEGKTVLDTLYFGRFNSTTNVEDHTESSVSNPLRQWFLTLDPFENLMKAKGHLPRTMHIQTQFCIQFTTLIAVAYRGGGGQGGHGPRAQAL